MLALLHTNYPAKQYEQLCKRIRDIVHYLLFIIYCTRLSGGQDRAVILSSSSTCSHPPQVHTPACLLFWRGQSPHLQYHRTPLGNYEK